jgi:hypothetical protein
MRTTPYYSVRTGQNPLAKGFDLNGLRNLFKTAFIYFEDNGYFQESLGYWCVDQDFVPGKLGHDLEGSLFLELRKSGLTPIKDKIHKYTEDDLFDVIEFLHDHCSKPKDGTYHSWNNCGMHYTSFENEVGQREYREKINKILKIYEGGYELSSKGEILILLDNGLEELIETPLPDKTNDKNINDLIEAAKIKFRRSRSSINERRDAIRDLADVLEFIRPDLKSVLNTKDEQDLFNIVNNFGIRHNNQNQRTNYDKAIWYSWLFHYYLATIHAATRLIEKNNSGFPPSRE